jgi:opacity protein-like surface antigen
MQREYLIKAKTLSIVFVLMMVLVKNSYCDELSSTPDIDLFGSIKQYFVWGNNNYTPPPPTYPANTAYNGLKNGNQFTNFQTYTGTTKLGASIKEDRIRADIEGDFESDNNTFWLLKAYFSYAINDNLSFLIGEANPIGELNTFSDNYYAMPGFNQTWPFGTDQLRLEGSFETHKLIIKPTIALENLNRFFLTDDELKSKNITTKIPGIGTKVDVEFPFEGSKARLYGFLETQQIYINYKDSHWPYVYGLGMSLPVKNLTLQSEFVYGHGATNYVGLIESGDSQSETEVPNCYSAHNTARKFRAYNIEANFAIIDNWGIYGGFDKLNFMSDLNSSNQSIQSADGRFLGISYNLTKSTTLRLEYDIFKTNYYNQAQNITTAKARQLFLSAEYDF